VTQVKAYTPNPQDPAGAASTSASEAVAVADLTFTYAEGTRPALRDVTMAQFPGEMIGIMGASGAGKSTLAKVLNRIIPEFEAGDFHGVVRLNGRSILDARVSDVAPEIGMVFQDFESQLFSTTAAHEVAFAMEQVGMGRAEMLERIGPALEAVGLKGFDDRDPTTLSGGQKQRLAVASVLALKPSVIVLDEPTTDLDPEGRAEVFALIRQLRTEGRSLIVIEHESDELRQCDRIVLLRDGAIITEGTPATVMPQLELLEDCGVHPPSLNRVLALLGINGHARNIDHAEAEIRRHFPNAPQAAAASATAEAAPTAPGSPLLEVENVSYTYPDGPHALDGVSLRIAPGEFLAIVGQNGSGKTTLAKSIVGLLKPDSGRILLEGRDRAQLRPAETAGEVGYVFQNPDHQIFAETVELEVKFGPRNFGLDEAEIDRRCDEVLRAVGLDVERASDPFLLSKGERQRLAVASVLALRPRLLILDEPTTGLDYREQRKMMKLVTELNEAGVAIVMITHTPWLVAEYARRVVLMRGGRKLFDGEVRDFFAHDEMLRTSSFRPPEVTALSRRFGTLALTPGEFASFIRERAK
jgi:energy-coupling factor transporter ATP-binding protein EcfA2